MARYTMDIDDNFDKKLSELVETTDASNKADVIRRAIASYKYLKDNVPPGHKISITDSENKVTKDVILP